MWDLSETSTLKCSLGLSLPEHWGGCAGGAVGRGCLTRRPRAYLIPVPWLWAGPCGLQWAVEDKLLCAIWAGQRTGSFRPTLSGKPAPVGGCSGSWWEPRTGGTDASQPPAMCRATGQGASCPPSVSDGMRPPARTATWLLSNSWATET